MPRQCAKSLPVLACLMILCIGCSIHNPRRIDKDDTENVRPKAIIEKEKRTVIPGPPPLSEQVAPVIKETGPPARLFTMSFKNAPLGEILQAVTLDSKLNLSVESGVNLALPVTVQIRDVLFEEILNMIIGLGAGYAWRINGNTLHVQQFEERIYNLEYIDIPSETEIEVGGDMLATSVEDSGISGKYQIKSKREKIHTDFWSGLAESLEGMKSEKGMLRINRNTGVIFIRDTPKRTAAMVRFLDELAEALHRQVFIEARIFEVSLKDEFKYGIDWTKVNAAITEDFGILPDAFELSVNSGGTLILSDTGSFKAVVDYLETQGDISVVSNPHLSVMNGQSALLTVGYQLPFGDVDGVDRDTETGLITYGTSIKRAILGLQLGITPHISNDGIVTLNIVPTITRIQGEIKVEIPTTATSSQSISNPVISLQELSTMVRVREGNTIVLAGLINRIREVNHEGLPWIGNVPFLKFFFKHMANNYEERELVIFITPHVRKKI